MVLDYWCCVTRLMTREIGKLILDFQQAISFLIVALITNEHLLWQYFPLSIFVF